MENMGKSFEIKKSKNGYRLSGVLDERVSIRDFQVIVDVVSTPVEFDFNSVSRASSSGIVEWMRFIKQYPSPFYYVNCPVWLVNQFNLMSDLIKQGESAVVSLWAPYFCEEDESNHHILIRIPKDVSLAGGFNPGPVHEAGKEYTPDFVPDRYLKFVSLNAEGFQRFFSQHPHLAGSNR
ncbi:MAG: hypothetical protein WCH11_00780 [Bdellovibrio sp.]